MSCDCLGESGLSISNCLKWIGNNWKLFPIHCFQIVSSIKYYICTLFSRRKSASFDDVDHGEALHSRLHRVNMQSYILFISINRQKSPQPGV